MNLGERGRDVEGRKEAERAERLLNARPASQAASAEQGRENDRVEARALGLAASGIIVLIDGVDGNSASTGNVAGPTRMERERRKDMESA